MAGIGFTLRKLTQQENLIGIMESYTHSTIVSMGPWLLTILSLGSITLFGSNFTSFEELDTFRIIIIYNFAFSLVFSGPVLMVVTRYTADLIFRKDVKEVPGMMLGSLALMFGTQMFAVLPFYFYYVNLSPEIRLAALINYFLITGIWLVSIFFTALKAYNVITFSFAIGMLMSTFFATIFASFYSVAGMVNGFSIGLAFILCSLIARVLTEYPYQLVRPFGFLRYFSKYWDIALGGFVYNLAIWIDKWIMWFSPHRTIEASGMISYPNYDSAMFLAYLSIIPAMAMFIISIETNFFDHYLKFYRDIQLHAPYSRILKNQKAIVSSIIGNARNLLIIQGSICLVVILIAPRIFQLFDISFLQIGIFRFGVMGAFFHVMMAFLSIILFYFDLRRVVLAIYSLFLVTNSLFTYICMNLGFNLYGYGYFLASLVTFVVAYIVTIRYANQLPYITFIKNNSSV